MFTILVAAILGLIGVLLIATIFGGIFPEIQSALESINLSMDVSVDQDGSTIINLNILKVLIPLVLVFGFIAYALIMWAPPSLTGSMGRKIRGKK